MRRPFVFILLFVAYPTVAEMGGVEFLRL